MTLLLSRFRPRAQPVPTPLRSVREVCLIGGDRGDPRWGSGDRVTVSGRAYRVESAPAPSRAEGDAPRYVFLAADSRAGS